MKKIFCLSALLTTLLLSGCAALDAARVTEKVEEFLSILQDTSPEGQIKLNTIAPDFSRLSQEERDAIASGLNQFDQQKITSVEINGASAVATILLSSNTKSLQMSIPLSFRDDNWTIDKEITFVQNFEVVPAP